MLLRIPKEWILATVAARPVRGQKLNLFILDICSFRTEQKNTKRWWVWVRAFDLVHDTRASPHICARSKTGTFRTASLCPTVEVKLKRTEET